MPKPIDVVHERTFGGTPRRIYQLLADMGTSQDVIWPFPSQPFLRSAGPLAPGVTEEWHGGLHAVLEAAEPEQRIVWRIDTPGFDGTHGFSLEPSGKRILVRHRASVLLSDDEGVPLWRRLEGAHEAALEGLFDKLARVLKR
ncbi:MAG: hypothetical protein ABSD03_13085 [Vulcanimicrobiaceae bacterium]